MTSLTHLRQAHASGTLPKPYFLGAVYALVQPLFEFQASLAGTQIKEIIIGASNLRVRIAENNLELIFHPDEVSSLITGILAFGDTERMERKALLAAASQSKVILDVGANVGWYSLHFSRVAPEASIYAFEPASLIYGRLLENLALNQVTTVTTENLALQDQEHTDFLYFHPAETGATSARNNRGFAGTVREEVRATTLDRYCAKHALSPDLIKCDVEGGELSVIKGGLETLRRSRPVVFLELLRKWSANFGYHPNEVIEILKTIGYRSWAIEADGIQPYPSITDDTVATNFLFTCDDKHDALIERLSNL